MPNQESLRYDADLASYLLPKKKKNYLPNSEYLNLKNKIKKLSPRSAMRRLVKSGTIVHSDSSSDINLFYTLDQKIFYAHVNKQFTTYKGFTRLCNI